MLGALIGAGASLLGGLINKKESDNSSKSAIKSQEKINASNQKYAREAEERQNAKDREFAQNSIAWRVADAQRAGIHPLAALGTQPFTPSTIPVHQDQSMPIPGQSGMGDAVANGVRALSGAFDFEALKRAKLENELLATQIATSRTQLFNARQAGNSVTSVTMGGKKIEPHPGWSDAQEIQNRYGEPAEWLYFPAVAAADAWKNAGFKWEYKQGRNSPK